MDADAVAGTGAGSTVTSGSGRPRQDAPGRWAGDRTFVRRVLIALLLVGLAAALWAASHALLLLFGAILFAIAIRGLAGLLRRVVPVGDGAAVIVVLLILLVVAGGVGFLFGSQISQQFSKVAEQVPDSLEKLEDSLRSTGWGQQLLALTGGVPLTGGEVQDGGQGGTAPEGGSSGAGLGWLVRQAGSVAAAITGALGDLLLVLFGAVYLAFQPGLYRAGIEKLVPADRTDQIGRALDATGGALWKWSAGMLVEMVLVGTITGIGLWLLGVPAPVALGLIAGVLEFIPIVGPILAAIPAILLAFTVSPDLALWTALFYVALQQVEGNLILPLIQRRAVALPPVVSLFALLVFGTLFGAIGVLLAVPLAVTAMTLVQVLYVRDTLGKPVTVEGG